MTDHSAQPEEIRTRLSSRVRRSPRRTVAQLAVLGALGAAALVLERKLAGYPWHRLNDDLAALGPGPVGLAVLATAISYTIMIGYDALALAYVEHAMPARRYAAASFVATAFGNTLGASALVGAALRARAYSAWGLPAFAITRVVGFNLITLSLGSSALISAGLIWGPPEVMAWLPLSRPLALLVAIVPAGAVVGYLLWCGRGKPPLSVREWRIDRPSRAVGLVQLTVSTVEWLTMAAVLFVLLPAGHHLSFLPFAVLFVLATTLGLASNVPGGVGVVEAVLVLALDGDHPSPGLVTALVAYRLIYYLLPLALAAVVLAVLETRRRPGRTGAVRVTGDLTPSVLALLLVILGAVLIVTGELPAGSPAGLDAFNASLAGIGVLLLARGLHRRLRGAWILTLLLIGVAALTHPVGPALAAVGFAVLLVLARRWFNRSTAVLTDPRNWLWPVLIAGVAALLWWHRAWSGLDYRDRPWLSAVTGEGSGAVRVAVAVAVLALIVAGTRLQVPAVGVSTASMQELERAVPILARASHGNASLVWTGDKQVMFSTGQNALLMYRVHGRSWVVMGDPVGDEREFDELIWLFLRACVARCGRPVFYCVRDDLADLYREHGLSLVKLGEEAMITLEDFSMTGKHRAKLRSECRSSSRAGVRVEVLSGARLAEVMPQLREVSDGWLQERHTREKSFSLGAFDEEYVSRFPVAVARIEDEVVAFASLWASGAGHEVKVDLMRRRADAPRTAMTHLFVESMLWAQANGYHTFNIGMAPLAGLRTDGTGSFWERVGHQLWTHGEHFYNFQGLRTFKERFAPTWETRYVASLGGPGLPVMMLDVAALVAGGVRGMVPHLHRLPGSPGQARTTAESSADPARTDADQEIPAAGEPAGSERIR